MIALKLNKHKVVVYDSIEDLPIVNYHKYNKLMLVDSGIGSELSDIDAHITKIASFIKTNPNLAVAELTNLQQSLYFINQNISPKNIAYMALISEVDGDKVTDLSDDNLMKIFGLLNEEKMYLLEKVFNGLKKKINDELEQYFPLIADNVLIKEAYELIKRRANIQLHGIITGEDIQKEIDGINTEILTKEKPKAFSGKESILIKIDKNFDQTCMLISQKLNANAKVLTVMEYYNAVELISDKK